MHIILERFAYTDMGTFGRMTIGDQTLYTVERPWLDNAPTISCIPEGIYSCKARWYNGGGYEAIEVLNVPNRTHILMHIGNTMNDSAGCILINSRLGSLGNMWAGLASKPAFAHLMENLGDRDFTVEITQYMPSQSAKGTKGKFSV